MPERLLSVGLDVGTTSTQMVLSELLIENRAGSFSVPKMEISQRSVRYKSPVHFTPLKTGNLVDGEGLRELVDREYACAGIAKTDVDTGAIIITGETSRKENAAQVLSALSEYAGDFVVATAGPDLESVLAAKGAGAVAYSEKTGRPVLHMDIGGGTSNLALIEKGKIRETACLNVGGRLLKISQSGRLTYVSPVLKNLFSGSVGDYVNQESAEQLAQQLVAALEMAACLRERTALMEDLITEGAAPLWETLPEGTVISFSGGVADCIAGDKPWLAFGDIGPELGTAIRNSLLCRGDYMLGTETIRATVIGAGSYSTQLSGSTVFFQNIQFPLKNLGVARTVRELKKLDGPGVLAVEGILSPTYARVTALARELAEELAGETAVVALETDMAKALGQQLALEMGPDARILCIDRVALSEGSYLDVGAPVGSALPVVVKTLVLNR